MHNCVRCGRAAASLEEINNGCPCGSKVFVFNKEAVEKENGAKDAAPPWVQTPPEEKKAEAVKAPVPLAKEESATASPEKPVDAPPAAETAAHNKEGGNGKAPESYFARTTFTSEDVENIKILREGVFLVDIKALSNNPVVLKDEEGVYYVKLPFENNGKFNSKLLGNGKNSGI